MALQPPGMGPLTKDEAAESKETKALVYRLYTKKGRNYLDHLFQGGLAEKCITVIYYPETGRVEAKVDDV